MRAPGTVRARLASSNRHAHKPLPRLGELDTLAGQLEPLAGLPDGGRRP